MGAPTTRPLPASASAVRLGAIVGASAALYTEAHMVTRRAARQSPRHEFAHRIERHRGVPVVHHYEVPLVGLHPHHDGLRIAHLTDLHVGTLTPHRKIAHAIASARAARPDLIVMTGDYMCYTRKFIGKLGELTRNIDVPIYAVLGNHDYWTDGEEVRRTLEANGIAVLRNQHSEITFRHERLTVVGIDDAITRQADAKRAFRGVRPGSRIVLSHAPSQADRAVEFGSSLILAGHTHGGHINIPKLTVSFAAYLGTRYLAGFFELDDSMLYVNRGVGASSVPIRAGAPSEIAILTLRTPPATPAR